MTSAPPPYGVHTQQLTPSSEYLSIRNSTIDQSDAPIPRTPTSVRLRYFCESPLVPGWRDERVLRVSPGYGRLAIHEPLKMARAPVFWPLTRDTMRIRPVTHSVSQCQMPTCIYRYT